MNHLIITILSKTIIYKGNERFYVRFFIIAIISLNKFFPIVDFY